MRIILLVLLFVAAGIPSEWESGNVIESPEAQNHPIQGVIVARALSWGGIHDDNSNARYRKKLACRRDGRRLQGTAARRPDRPTRNQNAWLGAYRT